MNAKVGSREASLMKFRTEYRSTMRNGKAAFEQAEERKLHQKGDEMKKLIVMTTMMAAVCRGANLGVRKTNRRRTALPGRGRWEGNGGPRILVP